ncbi:MAG: type I-U CRISPR-associated protein Csb2 [Candidatus Sumerlaeaceae bacterium]|nr:type I-U CRISPR-associated protein Csb2 [Candidatus Sumerlaeaceae bacterium]
MSSAELPTVARYEMARGARRLRVERTAAVGEALARAAYGVWGRLTGGRPSELLGGHDAATGRPARVEGQWEREHLRYLALDEDGDGWLDHVVLMAGRGFAPEEQRAMWELRRVLVTALDTTINLTPPSFGRPEDWRDWPTFGPACEWVSATPFIAYDTWPEFRRRGLTEEEVATLRSNAVALGRLALEVELRGWLASRKATADRIVRETQVEPYPQAAAWALGPPRGDRNARDKRSRRALRVRVVFEQPVWGPLALGDLTRYGLGLFRTANGR